MNCSIRSRSFFVEHMASNRPCLHCSLADIIVHRRDRASAVPPNRLNWLGNCMPGVSALARVHAPDRGGDGAFYVHMRTAFMLSITGPMLVFTEIEILTPWASA